MAMQALNEAGCGRAPRVAPPHPARAPEWCAIPAAGAPIRLFCFPYAGGGPATYRRWGDALRGVAQVCPVALPGRAPRLSERPLARLDELVEQIADGLGPHLGGPFAFFGHSFGGLVAYEVACALAARGGPLPLRLFVSAMYPPAALERMVARADADVPAISDAEFLRRFAALGANGAGLPGPALPALRADVSALLGYNDRRRPPLACAISVYAGSEDVLVPAAAMDGWAARTGAGWELRVVPGAHLFVETDAAPLVARLRGRLARVIRDGVAVHATPATDPGRSMRP